MLVAHDKIAKTLLRNYVLLSLICKALGVVGLAYSKGGLFRLTKVVFHHYFTLNIADKKSSNKI